MKKSLSVVLAIGLVVGVFAAAPAEAKKKKKKKKVVRVERSVEVGYTLGGIGIASPAGSAGVCPMTEPGSGECIEIPVESAKEKYVKVEITDASTTTLAGFISQGDVDGDGISDGYGVFCGAHTEPVELAATAPVRVSFYPGACDDGSPSIPTTGTIKVTFSNLP